MDSRNEDEKKEEQNSKTNSSEGGRLLGAVAFLAVMSGNPSNRRQKLSHPNDQEPADRN